MKNKPLSELTLSELRDRKIIGSSEYREAHAEYLRRTRCTVQEIECRFIFLVNDKLVYVIWTPHKDEKGLWDVHISCRWGGHGSVSLEEVNYTHAKPNRTRSLYMIKENLETLQLQ
jgi:hypothetical protein